MFTIRDFKVESGVYLRLLSKMFFARNWWWFLLPLLVCGVCGCAMADVRWLIVALMVAFVMYPMLLALIYFNYALTAEARWNIMEKTAVICDEGIRLTFTHERMKPHLITWGDISHVERNDRHIIFHLSTRKYTYFILPRDILPQQDINETQLLRYIRGRMG